MHNIEYINLSKEEITIYEKQNRWSPYTDNPSLPCPKCNNILEGYNLPIENKKVPLTFSLKCNNSHCFELLIWPTLTQRDCILSLSSFNEINNEEYTYINELKKLQHIICDNNEINSRHEILIIRDESSQKKIKEINNG